MSDFMHHAHDPKNARGSAPARTAWASRASAAAAALALALALGVASSACQGLLGVDFSDARPTDDDAASPMGTSGGPQGTDGGDAHVDPVCQATCKGCCTGSVCSDGTAQDACGGGGAACTSCGDVSSCQASACVRSLMLFGGMTTDPDAGTNLAFDDTWLWSGQSWKLAPATSSPPMARGDGAIGSIDGTVYMYGGVHFDPDPFGDTWSWSAAGLWKDAKASDPGGREGAAMARLGKKLVMFGGYSGNDIGPTALWFNDTWEWDGKLWAQPSRPSGASFTPSARRNAAIAPLGSKLVMFGGSDETGALLADTWEWEGVRWTQRTPAASPPGRAFHSMATLGNKVFMFGGDLSGNRTWEWDGTTWTHHDVLGPVPRQGAAMVTYGNKIVLFGGQGAGANKYFDDTWEWDGAAWTQRNVVGPSKRTLAAMVAP